MGMPGACGLRQLLAAGARLARDVGTSPAGANATVATARRGGPCRWWPTPGRPGRSAQTTSPASPKLPPRTGPSLHSLGGRTGRGSSGFGLGGPNEPSGSFSRPQQTTNASTPNPDDVAAHERRERAKRRCKLRPVGDGWHLDAHLDRVGGAEFYATWERIYQELFEADYARARELQGEHVGADRLDRTPDQRRADALVEMARRAGATRPRRPDATPVGVGRGVRQRAVRAHP